ncbi:unnamed protein product, partial [Brenthis ino]
MDTNKDHIQPNTTKPTKTNNKEADNTASINMTALFAAMPQPQAPSTSWSLVEPRKKKNRKRRERQRRSRTKDGITKGGTGNSEPDTEESERYTTDGDTPAAAPGGTGKPTGENQSATKPTPGNAAPVKTSTGPVGSYRSGTGGCPTGGGRTTNLSHTNKTVGGPKTAKDAGVRAAPGYKGGPSGQSALETARPSSSSGKSSSAQVSSKTTKTTHIQKAPTKQTQRQLLSSRPRLNSGTSEGETSEGGQTNKPNKRDRLDDTISPKVSSKRPRTTHTRRDGEASYAQATLTHLNVAITTNPRTDLTDKEATDIKDQLQKAIFTVAGNHKGIPSNIPFAPIFLGRTTLHEGVLKLKCRDDETLAWLKGIVPTFKAPREGFCLTLIEQRQLRPKVKAALYVPDYQGDADFLHKILMSQNRYTYAVSSWQLIHYDVSKGDRPGMLLYLGIPRDEIPKLLAEGRRVAYSHGSIYIRFFTPEGLSDVPPEEEPKTVDDNKPTDMETDKHTDRPHTVASNTPTDLQTDKPSQTDTLPKPTQTDGTDGRQASPLPTDRQIPIPTDEPDGSTLTTNTHMDEVMNHQNTHPASTSQDMEEVLTPFSQVSASPEYWEALVESD